MIADIKAIVRALMHFNFAELKENRLFKIGVVGAFGFLIQAFFFEIFGIQFQIFRPSTAALLGAELAVISGFILNNCFTFHDRSLAFNPRMFLKFFQFNAAVGFSLVAQWVLVRLGEFFTPESALVLRLFNIAGVLIGFIFNYFAYTKLIWKNE